MPSIFFSFTSAAVSSISLRFVDLIRDLGDDDLLAVPLPIFSMAALRANLELNRGRA